MKPKPKLKPKQVLCIGILACAMAAVLLVPAAQTVAAQQLSGSVDVPQGAAALGTVEIPRRVMADGKELAAGSYDVQLTAQQASPEAVGALGVLERWVEFRQEDNVIGREVVSIVPQNEIGDVAKSAPPGAGSSRVELLKDNEYLRVWINQGGTHYLIHLAAG